MKSISKDDKKVVVHNSKYRHIEKSVVFEEVLNDDEFFYGIKSLFLKDLPDDYIQNQVLPDVESLTSLLFFQVDLKYRDFDLTPSSIRLDIYETATYGNNIPDYYLEDDGNGNLLYDGTIVGNCFYNSGVIILHNDIALGTDSLFDLLDDQILISDLDFKYKVQFFEDIIEIKVDENDYNYSFNETYDVNAPLYFNKIYLMNDNNQLIATATLSRPQKLFGHLQIVLDSVWRV